MHHRFATLDDVPLLARMNRQLTQDEGHRNASHSLEWFEQRMRGFLTGDYQAVLFELDGQIVAYALYTGHQDHADSIYLRQLFVDRAHRRRGIGRAAFTILRDQIWPKNKRLSVGILVSNEAAKAFWLALGFTPYSLDLELLP